MASKISSIILALTFLISCTQKNAKNQESIDKHVATKAPEKIEITDSMKFENYIVEADTAYFLATADSLTKLNRYLIKNEFTIICKIKGEYGYSVQLSDSAIHQLGWLQLKKLSRVLLTAPKTIKE